MPAHPIHPNVRLVSYWRASWGDTPEDLTGVPLHEGERTGPAGCPRHCAKCGSPALAFAGATNDSGTGWRQYFFQFHCGACGAYSLFHYDD